MMMPTQAIPFFRNINVPNFSLKDSNICFICLFKSYVFRGFSMSEQTTTTKERILGSAGLIFGKKGFKDTTIRMIAKAAQVNIAAINYHFQGKEGLYGAVLENVFHTGFTRFPATLEAGSDADPKERLRAFIRSMFYRLQSREGWGGMAGQGRLIARELLDPSPAFAPILERYVKPHKDLLLTIIVDIMQSKSGARETYALCHKYYRPVYLLRPGINGHPYRFCRQRSHRRESRLPGRLRLALFSRRNRQDQRRISFIIKGRIMKKRLRIILPLMALIIAGTIIFNVFKHRNDDSLLQFSGNIEVTETQMSFRIPGRLLERLVEEGDTVRANQPVARLEKSDQTIALAQAEANLAYAEAVVAELAAGSRKEDIDRAEAGVMQARQNLTELQNGSRIQDIESARAALDSAKATEQSAIVQLKQARIDQDRYIKLYKEQSVSKNVLETYQINFETAENRVKEAAAQTRAARQRLELLKIGPRIEQLHKAEAILKQAEAEFALIKAGPRQESIDQAEAKLRAAQATVNQAGQQLKYTELVAPMDAVVLSTAAEAGEYLNTASPVITLGQTDKPWLRAYINEKNLGRIKLGQKVEVKTDSFPEKSYSGRVSYISSQAEFTPKTVQTFEERVKLMFRIKVLLDNPDNELKPGMPADGSIDFSSR